MYYSTCIHFVLEELECARYGVVFTSDVHLCLTVGGTVARVQGRLLRRHLAISRRREGGEAV